LPFNRKVWLIERVIIVKRDKNPLDFRLAAKMTASLVRVDYSRLLEQDQDDSLDIPERYSRLHDPLLPLRLALASFSFALKSSPENATSQVRVYCECPSVDPLSDFFKEQG
jgi:hypothetical protein